MLRIRKLYTDPPTIDPVIFQDGVNFILGEANDSSEKTNGVGKTLCIEFINFALLNRSENSRLRRIPSSSFANDTVVCLDIEIFKSEYTIKRSLAEPEQPKIDFNGSIVHFEKLEDAKNFIDVKLHPDGIRDIPSFRTLLEPLIRDDRSEFKSIVGCYDTVRRIPEDYSPHMFILGLNVSNYKKVQTVIEKISEIGKDIKKVKVNVELVAMKDIEYVRADLNELNREVVAIDKSIEDLENLTGFELVKEEILELENQIEQKKREVILYSRDLNRTNLIVSDTPIDIEEVKDYYQRISGSLGDLVGRDLNEVIAFQNQIYEFQNQLIQEKRNELEKQIKNLNKELSILDKRYMSRLNLINKEGKLKNIKQTYSIYDEKSKQYNELKGFVEKYDKLVSDKQQEKLNKEQLLLEVKLDIQDNKNFISSFEQTVLDIHDYVQGSRRASFNISQTRFKRVVDIVMRIDDDGSHSIEREKVFIYDLALLLNSNTSKRHLGLLIHDNILDVDQDTLAKNIMYLLNEAEFARDQQYILTLNADRLNDKLSEIVEPYTRATYTKNQRFLRAKYKEVHPNR